MRQFSKELLQKFATELITQLNNRIPRFEREWTDFNDSDPGITLLALFAFLTENLLYQQNQIPPRAAALAQRLADAARTLANAGAPQGAGGLQRVKYFNGQLLTAEDFLDEQTYFRARLRRRNRMFHGAGIVSGLQVSVVSSKDSRGQNVEVQPGFALDPRGEELQVCTPCLVHLPARAKPLFVQLQFTERPTTLVPVPIGAATGGEEQFSRVEETVAIALEPAARADALSIARLTFNRGCWRVDRGFKPQRIRK